MQGQRSKVWKNVYISNSHFGMITLWELLSSPAVAGWQDAALTAFWNKTDVIIRIAVYITIDFRDRFV